MSELPIASDVALGGSWDQAMGEVTLTYDERFLRRKRLTTDDGQPFLVDLPKARSLVAGEALILGDGRYVGVKAADEPLIEVRGDLPRLAWHIGNRHAPCEVLPDALRVQREPVMQDMLERLEADVREVEAPFQPEGGAYGHGRTHGHSH
ncbi:urease accessory protein UreE [Aestuariibius sp. 2305UL40-4]|uniref:urease accessory protein UreE n=1 Tax=Aestuariibius violaceus TaxID=3234132 RepID=UPI00345E823F